MLYLDTRERDSRHAVLKFNVQGLEASSSVSIGSGTGAPNHGPIFDLIATWPRPNSRVTSRHLSLSIVSAGA